jgi:hypothetical protein
MVPLPSRAVGERAVLQGLGTCTDLNGLTVTILKWKAKVGRFLVEVEGTAERFKVLPINLVDKAGDRRCEDVEIEASPALASTLRPRELHTGAASVPPAQQHPNEEEAAAIAWLESHPPPARAPCLPPSYFDEVCAARPPSWLEDDDLQRSLMRSKLVRIAEPFPAAAAAEVARELYCLPDELWTQHHGALEGFQVHVPLRSRLPPPSLFLP